MIYTFFIIYLLQRYFLVYGEEVRRYMIKIIAAIWPIIVRYIVISLSLHYDLLVGDEVSCQSLA